MIFLTKKTAAGGGGDTTLTPTLRWTPFDAASLTLSGSDVNSIASIGSVTTALADNAGNNFATLVGTAGTRTAYIDSNTLGRERLIATGLTQAGGCDCTIFAIVKRTNTSSIAHFFEMEDTTNNDYLHLELLGDGRTRFTYADGGVEDEDFTSGAEPNFQLITLDMSTSQMAVYKGTNTTAAKTEAITGSLFTIDRFDVLGDGRVAFAVIDFFNGQLSQAQRETHASELNTLWASIIGT